MSVCFTCSTVCSSWLSPSSAKNSHCSGTSTECAAAMRVDRQQVQRRRAIDQHVGIVSGPTRIVVALAEQRLAQPEGAVRPARRSPVRRRAGRASTAPPTPAAPPSPPPSRRASPRRASDRRSRPRGSCGRCRGRSRRCPADRGRRSARPRRSRPAPCRD